MGGVCCLWTSWDTGVGLVAEKTLKTCNCQYSYRLTDMTRYLDCVLLAVHGGQVEGRVLLSVDSQGVTPSTSHVSLVLTTPPDLPELYHPLDGGVLVLHGGVHEGRVAGDGVAHVFQRAGAQLWVRTFLQTFEGLVTAGPVSPLGENQDLTGERERLPIQTHNSAGALIRSLITNTPTVLFHRK